MAPKRKLAPCPVCGGPQRGAGSGYCPKPACKERKRTKKKPAASSAAVAMPLPGSSSTASASAPSSASIAKPPADEEAIRAHATAVQPHLVEGKVAGDGNCLFRAISTHLPQGEAYHTDLRRLAVAYVAEHPDKFATTITVDEPLESWLTRMARPKEWSDNAVLQAIADRFKLCMLIWHAHLPGQRPVLVNSFDEPAERYVYLMLHEEAGAEHYNPLTLQVHAAEEVQEEQKEDRLLPVAKRRDRRSAKRRAEHDQRLIVSLRRSRAKSNASQSAKKSQEQCFAVCKEESQAMPRAMLLSKRKAKRCASQSASEKPRAKAVCQAKSQENALQSAKRKAKSDAKQSAKRKAKSDALQSAKRKAKSDAKQSAKKRAKSNASQSAIRRSTGKPGAGPGDWLQEHRREFRLPSGDPPLLTSFAADTSEHNVHKIWLKDGSWQYCDLCGLRRWVAAFPTIPTSKVPCVRKCKPSCDKSRYCTPTADHFPPELAVLSAPEREELALLTFYVQFVTLRGGKAPVTAKKKRGVISGRWKATSPDDSSDPKVRMALRWLLKNNALYRKYFDMHKKLLEVNVGETKAWSYIPTAMLLLRHHGVEVAAYPWLYPHGYMSDTSFIKANKNDKPSIKASWAHKVFGGFLFASESLFVILLGESTPP